MSARRIYGRLVEHSQRLFAAQRVHRALTVEMTREERYVTPFWYVIITLGIIAAIINFALAFARRSQPLVALVRVLAGVLSLVPPIGIIIGKSIAIRHPFLQASDVFIAFGVFVFAVLVLPTYFERSGSSAPKMTMQQRAARPANATVRLRDAKSEEWMN